MIAVVLVILVIFLFLRSASATFIPALAVPISLLGTCATMYLLGFSINNMTLLALTLSVGFVVDDAIVMLENIVRHIENGMRPYEAALKGAREIGFTIVSITFSLIAVFIPVLLMGGIVGRVFREFAVTVAVAIVVSGFVSLTLTPMLCARMLKAHDAHKRPNIVLRVFEAAFNELPRCLRVDARQGAGGQEPDAGGDVRDHRADRLSLRTSCRRVSSRRRTPGFLTGTAAAATDTSFEAMVERQFKLDKIVREDPAVDFVNTTVGAGGFGATGERSADVHRPETEGGARLGRGRDRSGCARRRRRSPACARSSRAFRT